jgi:hypothetical protein
MLEPWRAPRAAKPQSNAVQRGAEQANAQQRNAEQLTQRNAANQACDEQGNRLRCPKFLRKHAFTKPHVFDARIKAL